MQKGAKLFFLLQYRHQATTVLYAVYLWVYRMGFFYVLLSLMIADQANEFLVFLLLQQATSPLAQVGLNNAAAGGGGVSEAAGAGGGGGGGGMGQAPAIANQTTTSTESLTTPILSLATPNIFSSLPPLFSSFMGDFPFGQIPGGASAGGGGGGGASAMGGAGGGHPGTC